MSVVVAAQTMTGVPVLERARQTERAQERAAHLPALTGLRLCAALLIVVHHFGSALVPSTWPLLPALASSGYVGVDLFFILSGFILAYTYVTPSATLRGTRRAYYVGRIARLLPVYLLGLGAGLGPLLWWPLPPVHTSLALTIATTLTFTQAWVPFATQWDGPSWSLSVEVVFYLAFPLLVRPLAHLLHSRRALLWALPALCLLVLAAPLLYLLTAPDGAGPQWQSAYWLRVLSFNPLPRLPEFLLGVATARLFVMQRAAGRRALAGTPGVLAALGLLALVLGLGTAIPFPLMHNGALDAIWALLIYALAWGEGPLSRALAHPAILVLGEASYALYLLHVPLWQWLLRALGLPPADLPASWPLAGPVFALYVALALALAVLVLGLVERPARRALRRALAGPSEPPRPRDHV